MAKTKLTMENVSEFLGTLSFHEFKSLVEKYSKNSKHTFDEDMQKMVSLDLQDRLKKLGINAACPNCSSVIIVKNGKRANGIQEYKCTECNRKFTIFTGTILEKTRWHWDVWIKVLELTLNNYSIERAVNVLQKDYGCESVDPKTVWLWRIKLIHALASYPMPKLTGVVQVDETFIREAQKGSRNLQSTLTHEPRTPRYGRQPSKLGTMGPEFATIITAIDAYGYCVCKISGLGKLTVRQFVDLFEDHLSEISYLCSDANDTYSAYCGLRNIPHYIKPSGYLDILNKSGYEIPDIVDPKKEADIKAKNQRILHSLYKDGLIDRIENVSRLTYEEFGRMKKQHHLNLGKVNELHSELKKFIYTEKTNVSTKFLSDYIGYFTYIKNWSVRYGHYPSSQKDAESIFEDILKLKVNFTVLDVNNQTLELPQPSGRYVAILKKETQKAREATKNEYFKFDEEDGVKTFNKREYLSNQTLTKLYSICKECGLKGYRKLPKRSMITQLLEIPNIDSIIYKLLQEDRYYRISEEDLAAIADGRFTVKKKPPVD